MRFLPTRALEAAEALLAAYADDGAKYREPKWRTLPAEQHVAAALRHLAGFSCSVADAESRQSHALHLLARAAFAVAQEQTEGRDPPDPMRFAIDAVDLAARALIDDDPRHEAIVGELLSITVRLRRLHVAEREARDGGVNWRDGNLETR